MSKMKWLVSGAVALVAAGAATILIAGGGDGRPATPPNTAAITLTAAPSTVQLGNRKVKTWAFNGRVPGPEIRLNAGQTVLATVRNELRAPLTIHWHGIALRNDMDGVENVTQKAIAPGKQFVYRFTAPEPGTYFYHPHTGTQLDRGLYAPLIVEDPAEKGRYDRELTLMLDDWTDGVGASPDAILARLKQGMATMPSAGDAGSMKGMNMGGSGSMKGMNMGGMPGMKSLGETGPASPLGDDTGDVNYPLYLVNGRPPASPAVYDVKAGDRIRLRLINAGSDTPFRVAAGDRKMSVVATDGFPVRPVSTASLLIGMGERYDVVVRAPASGSLPVVAQAEGKSGRALAILRTSGAIPKGSVSAPSLGREPLSLSRLRATSAVALPARKPNKTFRVTLSGSMQKYDWRLVSTPKTLMAAKGDRVRLVFENRTAMWHPMHLHGTTFEIRSGSRPGPRKDTVIVPPRKTVTVEFDAKNPGRWLLHCHNIYHAEAGMKTELQIGEGPFFKGGAGPGEATSTPPGQGSQTTSGGGMEGMDMGE